jgi:hypothetical protein
MNLKTTVTLVVLSVAGAAYWASSTALGTHISDSGTLNVLKNDVTEDQLTRIEIRRDANHLILERKPKGQWSLPGNWPVREPEVRELVDRLSNLRSRFAPMRLGDKPERYGLAEVQRPLHVDVQANGKTYKLILGEEPAETNRFSRPTFLRLGDEHEVLRLAPNLVANLDRPADYYQQRRLFPSERPKTDKDTPTRSVSEADSKPLLDAKALAVQGGDSAAGYAVAKSGSDWELQQPVRDAVDPDKIKSLLAAVPDVWAEQFVEPGKSLADCGLDKPERSMKVTLADSGEVKLLIGKESQVKTRTVTRPPPMDMPPGMPRTPQQEVVHDAYCYAKLANNDQIFEIKADKLKELFTPAQSLRDAHLARFKTDDVKRVEIRGQGVEMTLAKDKDQWKLEKPVAASAENSRVNDLLDKLTSVQARDKDIIDGGDPKSYGLDNPAATVTVEVQPKDAAARTLKFEIGREDGAKKKVYVRTLGRERINAVEDTLAALVRRPALAYRGRKLIDLTSADVARIDIERGKNKFSLEQTNGKWALPGPPAVPADGYKVNQLAGDLGRLEAVEFIDANPADLESKYGLGPSGIHVKMTPAKKDQQAVSLVIGKPRQDRPEYYARLDSSPAVFTIKKDLRELVDQGALAFRPQELWQLVPSEITEIARDHEGVHERLVKDGDAWRLTEPFYAPVDKAKADNVAGDLATLKVQRYETAGTKELASYGLDKPARLSIRTKPTGKDAKPEEHVVLIGKSTADKTAFAKLPSDDSVFILDERVAAAAATRPLDYLDRELWALDRDRIDKIQWQPGGLTLRRDAARWTVEGSTLHFDADSAAVASLLGGLMKLRAERFADFGGKPGSFGLDKPTEIVRIDLKPAAGKPESHTIAIGGPVANETGSHFARVDDGKAVAVLSPGTIKDLKRSHLDFVDRSMWKFDPASVSELVRGGPSALTVSKKNGVWELTKPAPMPADGPTVETLIEELSALKASRVAAYPAHDPKAFGLAAPAATIQVVIRGANSKSPPVLKIGKPADASGGRFAQVEGSPAVGVIPEPLAKKLLAGPLGFRDRGMARFSDADRVKMTRGGRHVVFAKIEGTWKMVQPISAEAEQNDLEDWVNALARLRADELVAEHSTDLQNVGLDRPQVEWRLSSGDKEVLHLAVGSPTADGRAAARVAGNDMVFRLDPALSAKATGEYRSRSLWLPLDSAQVESIRFGYLNRPFVLRKVDGKWISADQPKTPIRAEAVSSLMDVLARLRAERFIVDSAADLKLYGLAPPELTLDVATPSDKRTLYLGRAEGGSKRRYGCLAEPGRSDVFVISDADSQAIMQTLASLGEKRPGR